MAFPVLLWDDILRNSGAIITASSTDTGYAVADVADLKPWKIWRSAVLTSPITIDIDLGASGADNADTLGIVNGNIKALGGTITVLADTVTPPVTTVQAAYTPSYDEVELKTFTAPGNKRYWRISIAHAAPPFTSKPFIGELFLGMRTTMPEYMDPEIDPFNKQTEASIQHSEGGQYLGAVTRGRLHREPLNIGSAAGMARSFYTSDLNAFLDNHYDLYRPFFFQIDSADADFTRPFYLVKPPDGQHRRQAIGGMWGRLGLNLPAVEAFSEAA